MKITTEHLREVAHLYIELTNQGKPPRLGVARHYDVSRDTADRWIRRARKDGLLKSYEAEWLRTQK